MSDASGAAQLLSTTESFGHNMRVTNRLIQRDLGARLGRMGLNLGQWYALRALWDGDEITQIELAQRSGFAGPAMVSAVRALLGMGLVTRHRPSDDKRKYVIKLTEKGWAARTPALAMAVEANTIALQGIAPDDVATCLRVLQKAHVNLAQAAQDNSVGLDTVDALLFQLS
ncbi:MarR family winged helix-turn-helix transcriptional regulator [Gemmobacter sp.]|uniref:MarR family winged helix-turn-helix transcriptional regulator n=1 Tax=Gemmobacter sp. TaxID=1898957 RepID=UPI002AFFE344|nr:MarR family winged helix-turn-helix transcriptional regulator [Gemmobacter sp.]